MAKGFFTQGFAILLSRQVTLDEICECLADYKVVKRLEGSKDPAFSGDAVVVAYKPEVNGYTSIDLYPSQWPDHMGDPKSEPMLFATWSTGHFGPYAYPGGLARASQQCWRWADAQCAVSRHVSVMRLRMSYLFGGGRDAPVFPEDYEAQDELLFLTGLAQSFSSLNGAICYFNPNGEVLLPFSQLTESFEYNSSHQLPPLDLWSNIRLFNIDDSWSVMDSVGNWQFDSLDHEVAFPQDFTNPSDVDNFIRNATLYILNNGDVIKDGDTMDGPAGRRWQARRFENGLSDPTREVLRWLPCGVSGIPPVLLGANKGASIKKMPFWKLW